MVAVGDLHGAFDDFVGILRETRLLDERNRWIDPRACLVQLGDVLDRGGRPRAILDLLMDLEQRYPDRVEMVLGNHETMRLTGDLRYADHAEFAEFAPDETVAQRDEGYREFLRTGLATGDPERDRIAFDQRYPPGWFAQRRAFSREGAYGAWLLNRPAMVVRGGTVFVHAGLDRATVEAGISASNRKVRDDLHDYLEARRRLIAAGLLNPLTPFAESLAAARVALDQAGAAADTDSNGLLVREARRFVAFRNAEFARPDGPMWTRDLSDGDEGRLEETIPPFLAKLGVSRLVVGHTPSPSNRIGSRLGGRVYLIDTGLSAARTGAGSALVIDWNGRVRAVYPGRTDVLEDPPLSDADAERILREGRMIRSEEIGTGITRPRKLLLSLGDVSASAAFKTADIRPTGVTRFPRDGIVLQFVDSYLHERAAFVLDRLLGLQMVPPTVIREIGGERGAVILWVSDSIDEIQRRERRMAPPDRLALEHAWHRMRLFDALISNPDHNLGNQLWTVSDWRLHLIDHSRSFRLDRGVDASFLEPPYGLPRALLDRLTSLDEKAIAGRLEGALSKAQVKALLARRNRILEKIARDRERFGDGAVFDDPSPVPPAASAGAEMGPK